VVDNRDEKNGVLSPKLGVDGIDYDDIPSMSVTDLIKMVNGQTRNTRNNEQDTGVIDPEQTRE